MNSNHYPSLELCKKLTEIGFPKNTDAVFHKNSDDKPRHCDAATMQRIHYYSCPSVMEMLDVLPTKHPISGHLMCVAYEKYWEVFYGRGFTGYRKGSLPDMLAETILWLHSEGHLKF